MAVSVAKFQWGFQDIERLIKEYEKHPCLYNTKIRDYKDREKRKLAFAEIAVNLKTTTDDITKKLNSLRSQYCRERAKLNIAPKSDCSTENVQKSRITWAHFESLQFLNDFTISKATKSNVTCEDPMIEFYICEEDQVAEEVVDGETSRQATKVLNDQENVPEIFVQEPSTKRLIPKIKSVSNLPKRRRVETEESDLLQKAVSVLEKANASANLTAVKADTDELFGLYIASELRSLKDEHVKSIIKHKIQNIIFEAQVLYY